HVFFSSRRRHTRCLSDWSSDVCSSDLLVMRRLPSKSPGVTKGTSRGSQYSACFVGGVLPVMPLAICPRGTRSDVSHASAPTARKIGRASCRERVWMAVVAVAVHERDRQ